MKLIIAGSRTITDGFVFTKGLDAFWALASSVVVSEVVCGMAGGVDEMAFEWATARRIPVKKFHPSWSTFGLAAGPIRNRQMAEYADALLLIWDGKSKGSASMKREAERVGIPVFEHIVHAEEER